jgi:hypothetical protein
MRPDLVSAKRNAMNRPSNRPSEPRQDIFWTTVAARTHNHNLCERGYGAVNKERAMRPIAVQTNELTRQNPT